MCNHKGVITVWVPSKACISKADRFGCTQAIYSCLQILPVFSKVILSIGHLSLSLHQHVSIIGINGRITHFVSESERRFCGKRLKS